jgi:hypothetical protein
MYFDEVIKDQYKNDTKIALEFGRMSGNMYLEFDGKLVVVDEETGRKIYDRMMDVGIYLQYDKPPGPNLGPKRHGSQ